jgi:hypothetical protein
MKQFLLMLVVGMALTSCGKKDNIPPAPEPFLKLNTTKITFPPVLGTVTDLIVESNINYKVSLYAKDLYNNPWATINKISGHGNDTLRITVIKENVYSGMTYGGYVAITPVDTTIRLKAITYIEQKYYDVQQLSEKTFGGTGEDYITGIVPAKDGGLFLTGITGSNKNGDVGTNHGDHDAWMIKLNSNRDTVWTRVMGGAWYDGASKAIATADGGFVVAGYTQSNNTGDVGANHGKTDWWIIKLTSNGDTAWTKLIGGTNDDFAKGIEATADGGFVVVGSAATSIDENVMAVKFNSSGDIVWQKTFGGTGTDKASAVTVYPNGSIMIAATTQSNNTGDVGANHGLWDYWIIKLTVDGEKVWMKTFGGDQNDTPLAIAGTADGGAVIAGSTSSNQSGDVGKTYGKEDMWVLKLNANGQINWNYSLGIEGSDVASDVKVTPDGSYLIAGHSDSKNFGLNSGNLLMLKLDINGLFTWNHTFGGMGYDEGSALLMNTDGSFYAVGNTQSSGHGLTDGWLLKVKYY